VTITTLLTGFHLIHVTAAAAGLPLHSAAEPPEVPTVIPTVINDTDGPLSLETTMSSDRDLDSMTPGDSTDWAITTRLEDYPGGALSVRVVSEGELATHADGAHLLLRQCSEPWEGGEPWDDRRCPAGATVVIDAPLHTLDPKTVHSVGRITAPRGPYFLATVSLPENLPDDLQSSRLGLGLGFTASGDEELVGSPEVQKSSSGTLAETGSNLSGPFLVAGLITLLAGVGVRLHFRTRTGSSR
jgi:hypothetical protein